MNTTTTTKTVLALPAKGESSAHASHTRGCTSVVNGVLYFTCNRCDRWTVQRTMCAGLCAECVKAVR